jgi:hypothetical protein
MKTPTPYKKLTFLERVTSFDYKGIQNLCKLYQKGEIEFIQGEWGERFKNKYPEDYPLAKNLLDLERWVTFDKCFEIQIYLNGKEIYAKVFCKSGNNMDGLPDGIKWIAIFKLKAKHLKRFESKMNYLIELKAVKQYDRERKEEEKKRIAEIKKTLFSSM